MAARAVYTAAFVVISASAGLAVEDGKEISDEQYYQMPRLFHLDQYEECLASSGVYCVGSFELAPEDSNHRLFQLMQRYSSNWVDHFNHTRLHRGLCLSRRCAPPEEDEPLHAWFSSCVNASTMSSYKLSARLYRLEYCERGAGAAAPPLPPLGASERALAAVFAALLALAAISTVLDVTLADTTKKTMSWALAWSLPANWRALSATPGGGGGGGGGGGSGGGGGGGGGMAVLDGLRVLGMLCFIVEHVCWLHAGTYLVNPRWVEQTRRDTDVMLVSNSTLLVQAFFLMSSFLLANKLLQQRREGRPLQPVKTFVETMLNRIVRMSPTYFIVVWFAASGWARLGGGPLWAPLVGAEAAVCRRKYWAHLLYLNNLLAPDDKCLIQTWYLAADMQLYCFALVLTLLLWRLRRGALYALAALLAASVLIVFALAYVWRLVPTYVLHRPEAVRALYRGSLSFNVVYQSPLGNAPGALAGLLLAHAHQKLKDRPVQLASNVWFRWLAWWAPWLAAGWVALSAKLAAGGADRTGGPEEWLADAALAATERLVFASLVAVALLGAMHGVDSPVRRFLSWRGWAAMARLSFGALLLHMLVNKALIAAQRTPTQLSRTTVILEWFGVAVASYLAALPLALLVELPTQRLYRALRSPPARAPPPPETKAAM